MAGHAYLVLIRDWNHAIQEVRDPLPEPVRVDLARDRERRLRMRLRQLPLAVARVAAPRRSARAQHAEDAHVVFDGRQPHLRAVPDHRLDRFDVAVALRALRQHDGGMLLLVDIARLQHRRPDAIDLDAVLCRQVLHAAQLIDRGIDAPVRNLRIAADMLHAVARQKLQMRVVGGCALATQVEQHRSGMGRSCGCGGLRSMAQGNCRNTGRGEKFASIHRGKNITSTLRVDMYPSSHFLHSIFCPIRSALPVRSAPIPTVHGGSCRTCNRDRTPMRGPCPLILIKAHHGALHRPRPLHIE